MFCHKCGKEIEDGSSFCCYCGAKMKEVETESVSQTSYNNIESGKNKRGKEKSEKSVQGKHLNPTLATVITLFVDFLALLLGSSLIAFIGVGGIFVMLIEFYFLKAIHKAVYKALTGKEWGTKTGKGTDSTPQSDKNVNSHSQEQKSLEEEHLVFAEQTSGQENLTIKKDDAENKIRHAEVMPSTSRNDFIIIREEHTQPIASLQSQPSPSLYHNDNNKKEWKWAESNYFTSVFPKIFHDVNINLGKSTVFCIIAILVSVISCVCIITCNSTHADELSEKEETTTPPSYENEEERWDAENCIYANFKHGIAFNLPKDMAWHKISGTAKHTVVKFVQPETQLTIFVNINPIEKVNTDKYTEDIWDVYEESVKLLSSIIQQKVNANSAEKVKDYHYRKAEICGKHAIKTFYKSEYSDDRYQDKTPLTTIDYTFLYNHCITTVTIKCFDDVMDFLQEKGVSMEDFLKCFQLTPISEKYLRSSTNKKFFRVMPFNIQNKHVV